MPWWIGQYGAGAHQLDGVHGLPGAHVAGGEPRAPAGDRQQRDVDRRLRQRRGSSAISSDTRSCPRRTRRCSRRPRTRWPCAPLGRCGIGRLWWSARTSRTSTVARVPATVTQLRRRRGPAPWPPPGRCSQRALARTDEHRDARRAMRSEASEAWSAVQVGDQHGVGVRARPRGPGGADPAQRAGVPAQQGVGQQAHAADVDHHRRVADPGQPRSRRRPGPGRRRSTAATSAGRAGSSSASSVDLEPGPGQESTGRRGSGGSPRPSAAARAPAGAARSPRRRREPARAPGSAATRPGRSTRRTSASAWATSGIVHRVNVDSTASYDASSASSRWPSSPPCSIGHRRPPPGARRDRSQATSAGSTACTEVTAAG